MQTQGKFPEQKVISPFLLSFLLYYSGDEQTAFPLPAFALHAVDILVVFLLVKASVANFNDLLSYD